MTGDDALPQVSEEPHILQFFKITQPDAVGPDGKPAKPDFVAVYAPEDCVHKVTGTSLGLAPFPDEIIEEVEKSDFEMKVARACVSTKMSKPEKLSFFETMRNTMAAGNPVELALELSVDQMKTEFSRGVLAAVRRDTSKGHTISEAMGRHRKTFGDVSVKIAYACEKSSRLQEAFAMMAAQLRRDGRLAKEMMKKLSPPVLGLFGAFAAAEFVMFYVMPQMSAMAKLVGGDSMPAIAQVAISLGEFLKSYPYLAALPFLIPILCFVFWPKIAKAETFQRKIVVFPLLGEFLCSIYMVRSLRVLAMTLNSGIAVGECYSMASGVTGNIVFSEYFSAIREQILGGEGEAVAFRNERRRIGPTGVALAKKLRQGATSGATTLLLDEIATQMEEDAETQLDLFARAVEPVVTTFSAVVISLSVIAMMTPTLAMLVHVLRTSRGEAG